MDKKIGGIHTGSWSNITQNWRRCSWDTRTVKASEMKREALASFRKGDFSLGEVMKFAKLTVFAGDKYGAA